MSLSERGRAKQAEVGRAAAMTLDGSMPEGAPSDESHVVLQATRLGRFTLLHQIGSGGMGTVFAAYDEQLDRKIALKILLKAHTKGLLESGQILREARAAARISHPNVIAIYEVGEADGHIHIAMEYVDGGTLLKWQTQGEHSWQEILGMYLQAGAALQAAHEAGVVHRDFKPDNVLLGSDSRPRVVDFGLARVGWFESVQAPREAAWSTEAALSAEATGSAGNSGRLTLPGVISGTPGYMSPEQYRGGDVDSRSDQWSFCAALFEALYGFLPFPGETIREQAESVHGPTRRPPPTSKVPEEVHLALLRGLSADPSRRFVSMAELLAALSLEQQDDVASGTLSRRRISTVMVFLALTVFAGVQIRQSFGHVAINPKDAFRAGLVVVATLLGAGLWQRKTLLNHRVHRHAWIIVTVVAMQNVLQRGLAVLLHAPSTSLFPFEMVIMAGGLAIMSLTLIRWLLFAPAIPVLATVLFLTGAVPTQLLLLTYPLIMILVAWGWNRAANQVKKARAAREFKLTQSGKQRRTISATSDPSSLPSAPSDPDPARSGVRNVYEPSPKP